MITSPTFAGKHYAVLGLARSGMAAVASLVASGAHVTAWDAREEPRRAIAKAHGDKVVLADLCTMDLAGFAAVVVSPGVPLRTFSSTANATHEPEHGSHAETHHPITEAAAAAGIPLICDIELFAQARAHLPPHRVVGITGTNGKSTTTALVHHICATAGLPSLMGGNIGIPILAQSPLAANAAGVPVYVLELSSYQIDLTYSLDCDVAVLLNVTPDHLDRYDGFEAYRDAKLRLFAMQKPSEPWHAAVIGDSLPAAPGGLHEFVPNNQLLFALDYRDRQAAWPSLQGPHNHQNAACAIAVAEVLGIDGATIERALRSFPGLPHRMELVAEVAGVSFINDSKATNPASAAPALAAFPPAADGHRRIHWILGGLPKGDDLDECAPFFGNIAAAYTIGDAGPRFAEILEPHMPTTRSEMLCEAIRQAMTAAERGDVVMLSPACASFDQFRDYEARGQAFREMVHALIAETPNAAANGPTSGGGR